MPEFSLKTLHEVFVSDAAISKAVSDAAARRALEKTGAFAEGEDARLQLP